MEIININYYIFFDKTLYEKINSVGSAVFYCFIYYQSYSQSSKNKQIKTQTNFSIYHNMFDET